MEVVEANGGRVVLADMVEGRSTTNTIERIVQVYGKAK
jgi:bifunctional ADP-heptose synthase (sugar kinase/adenylyltransferase)